MREFSAQFGPLKLELEWRLTLFTLILLPFLIWLGLWQLDRAEEKAFLAERYAQRAALPAVDVVELANSVAPTEWQDRKLSFSVTFAPDHYLLLDNRVSKGRVGFDVIALGQLEGAQFVAINLGFVPGDPARRKLPEVQLPAGQALVAGRAYRPLSEAYVLGDQAPVTELPAVIQAFDPEVTRTQLAQALSIELLPLEVRVDSRSPLAFEANWPVVNVTADKHNGYAVQWFTMAAVLFIAFVLRSSNLLALMRGRSSNNKPQP